MSNDYPDPYKFNYKKYMMEEHGLTESPNKIHDYVLSYDDHHMNNAAAIRVEEESEYMGIYKWMSINLRLYKKIEEDMIYIELLQEDQPFIYMIHSFSEIKLNGKNGIESHSIWNNRWARGLARYWVFDYVSKNYEFMMSDKSHTNKGKTYWEQILRDGIDNNMKVGIIDVKNDYSFTPLNDVKALNDYYGDEGHGRYRLIIYFK